MPLLEQLFCRQKFQAKKTPLGRRGIRVIVVVANSVSATANGLWWIIIFVYVYSRVHLYVYIDPANELWTNHRKSNLIFCQNYII